MRFSNFYFLGSHKTFLKRAFVFQHFWRVIVYIVFPSCSVLLLSAMIYSTENKPKIAVADTGDTTPPLSATTIACQLEIYFILEFGIPLRVFTQHKATFEIPS